MNGERRDERTTKTQRTNNEKEVIKGQKENDQEGQGKMESNKKILENNKMTEQENKQRKTNKTKGEKISEIWKDLFEKEKERNQRMQGKIEAVQQENVILTQQWKNMEIT